MGNRLANLPVVANSNINPSVFIMGDPTRDFAVVQASGVNPLPGVSQIGTKFAPGVALAMGGSTAKTVAAEPGDNIQIFTVGEVAPVTVAAGQTIPAWSLLTNDKANPTGNAAVAGSGDYVGGISLEAGTAGNIISALLFMGKA